MATDKPDNFSVFVGVIVILGLVLGFAMLWLVSGNLIDWAGDTQEIVLSSTPAVDNCDAATAVGDGACNARVAIVGIEEVVLIGVVVMRVIYG